MAIINKKAGNIPRQTNKVGMRCELKSGKSNDVTTCGTIIRQDAEYPFETHIKTDDGRIIICSQPYINQNF